MSNFEIQNINNCNNDYVSKKVQLSQNNYSGSIFCNPNFIKNILQDKDEFLIKQKNAINKEKDIQRIVDMIIKTLNKDNKKINSQDLNYWAQIIYNNSKKYNISPELIVGIIAKETDGNYHRQVISDFGAGPMQITKDTTKDFFDEYQANNVYNLLNPVLYDEIMYTKDFLGNKIKRFPTPKALKNACAKDDNFGIKVGILCFQVKYVRVVAEFKNISVIEAIRKLKDGSLVLTPKEQEKCINLALQNYNGVPSSKAKEQYATEVCDSLTNIGVDYKKLPVIPVSK